MSRYGFQAVSAAALSLALATAPAFAQGFNDGAAAGLAKLGIQAPPIESLTTEEVAQITNILASSDSDQTKKMHIEGILGNEATATGRLGVTQLQDSVASDLAAIGIDNERVQTLTISQLGQIENVMSSTASDNSKRAQVEKILAE